MTCVAGGAHSREETEMPELRGFSHGLEVAILGSLVGCLLTVGGCTSTPPLAAPPLQGVELALKRDCNCVLPAETAATDVAAVIDSINVFVVTAEGVASLICNAARTLPPMAGAGIAQNATSPPTATVFVNGVQVHVFR
jgi:hypothetical protein